MHRKVPMCDRMPERERERMKRLEKKVENNRMIWSPRNQAPANQVADFSGCCPTPCPWVWVLLFWDVLFWGWGGFWPGWIEGESRSGIPARRKEEGGVE